jgi:hypothetical protein
MTEEKVGMTMEECASKAFCEVIRHVDRRVDSIQKHEVSVHPFTDREIFNIHMPHSCSGLLRIAHCDTEVIILVEDGGSFLRYPKIP